MKDTKRCRIVPAIDLIDGRCVRLTMGDFQKAEIVADDPVKVARSFAETGFSRLHLVDLDGARLGSPQHLTVVEQITKTTKLSVDLSGGLRTAETVERALASGASSVVIGSAAVTNSGEVCSWISRFGAEKVIIGLDIRAGEVRIKGWSEGTALTIDAVLERFLGSGLIRVMSTEISRDGMMMGPADDLYRDLCAKYPEIEFIASGGVSCAQDVKRLSETGVREIIVGKALYSGSLNLPDVGEFIW